MKPSIRTLLLSSLLALGALPHAALAAQYEYHPQSAMRLGHAFDPKRPFDDRADRPCFKWKGAKAGEHALLTGDEPAGAQGQVSFEILEARTRSELQKALKMSAGLSARFTFMKGTANFEHEKTLRFDERTLTYVFAGSRVFPELHQKGQLALNLKGRYLLAKAKRAKRPDQFLDACGREVVSSVQRGTSIAVVYHIETSTAEHAERMRATLDLKFKSGSASFSLENEMKSVDERSRITIFAMQTGTDRVDARILDLITLQPGDIPGLRAIVQESMQQITLESSPVIQLGTQSVASISKVQAAFGSEALAEFGAIDRELAALQDRYLLIENRIELLDALTAQVNSEDHLPDALDRIAADRDGLVQVRSQVLERASTCLAADLAKECLGEMPRLPLFEPSRYVRNFAQFLGWQVSYRGIGVEHDPAPVRWKGTGFAVPRVFFKNAHLLSRAILYRGSTPVALLGYRDLLAINEARGDFSRYFEETASFHWQWCWQNDPCAEWSKGWATGAVINATKNNRYRVLIFATDGAERAVEFGGPQG
ncbi:MAG: hypothetical protein IT285_04885 [Bdellovibrionales bacterium]|nr:hypothetical protein [Bdellovibrionales bacterium]